MKDDGGGVLSRWSRLKRGELREDDPEGGALADGDGEIEVDVEAAAGQGISAEGDAEAAGEEGRLLTEADLPDIESLSYESDFSAFLQKNVPDHLHKMALRKLWASDPVLANVDGLNDYDLDYTIKEMMEIAAQSAEDLLRGTKRMNVSDLRAQEREAQRMAREPSRTAEPAASPPPVAASGTPPAAEDRPCVPADGDPIRVALAEDDREVEASGSPADGVDG